MGLGLVAHFPFRYVGVLHDINSENSSVALENVKSYGTEGRKQNPEEEIPASDNVYEYIVFRGSDVKDLRVEAAAPKENRPPPQIPNDPAILGVRYSILLVSKSLLFEMLRMMKHYGCKPLQSF